MYRAAFHKFFGSQFPASEARATAQIKQKVKVCFSFIDISKAGWGNWFAETYPAIYTLVINEAFTKAKAELKAGYRGMEIFLKRNPSGWHIESRRLTWVE